MHEWLTGAAQEITQVLAATTLAAILACSCA
jgi:hypothetical protein